MTATYPATSSKQYDTYAPLQVDPASFKSLAADLSMRAVAQSGLDDRHMPVQVGHRSSDRLPVSTLVQVDSGAFKEPHKMYSTGPTVTVKHIHPHQYQADNTLYSIDEQAQDHLPQQAYPEAVRPISNYPMYSGLQTAPPNVIYQTPRRVLNQPRKLAGFANANDTMTSNPNPMYAVRELPSLDMRINTQSHYINDFSHVSSPVSPHSPRRYQRPELLKRTRPTPDERFQAIPGEILRIILSRLKSLHLGPGSDSCATCWMRDVCSLSLTSRKWSKHARVALYVPTRYACRGQAN
jgi:hypothetical protein